MRSPADAAAPLLGGARGRFLAAPGRGYARLQGAAAIALLGFVGLLGVLRQVPCITGGWELPHASYRMCASPTANALLGTVWPEAPGRTASGLLSPAADWFAAFAGALPSPVVGMAILLVINFAALLLAGMALLKLLDDRSWFAVFALSPVVFFSIGQSLDPVGLALVLWALVIAGEGRAGWARRADGAGAGQARRAGSAPEVRGAGSVPEAPPTSLSSLLGLALMFAAAALISPMAVVVALGWCVALVLRGHAQTALGFAGLFMVASGVFVVVDGRFIQRAALWLRDGIDRGSLFSLMAYRGEGTELNVLALGLVIVVLALLAVLIAARIIRVPSAGFPAVGAAREGERGAEASRGAAVGRGAAASRGAAEVPDSMTILAIFTAAALLAAPRAGVSEALWLLPFAAAAVHGIVLHFFWMASEAALFIVISLSDVYALDPGKGLSPAWLFILTVLRWTAVVVIFFRTFLHEPDEPESGGAERDRRDWIRAEAQ